MLLLSLVVVVLETETLYFISINDMKHIHIDLAVFLAVLHTTFHPL
jgi:hypothetical protein